MGKGGVGDCPHPRPLPHAAAPLCERGSFARAGEGGCGSAGRAGWFAGAGPHPGPLPGYLEREKDAARRGSAVGLAVVTPLPIIAGL